MSWYPLGTDLGLRAVHPAPGRLLPWKHAVYRVVSVRVRESHDWTDQDKDSWQHAGMPDPWPRAPYVIELEHVAGRRSKHLRGGRLHIGVRGGRYHSWVLYPESGRWPSCSCCGEPMPCQAEMHDRTAAAAMRKLDDLERKMPGACWACSEPVTVRQQAITYAGPNVELPGGPEVVFHTRHKCAWAAMDYEERWLAAEPGRERMLTWPKCGGILIVHADGTSECTGGMEGRVESCQGHSTHDHGTMSMCYMASHGCPRGCSRTGHLGIRHAERKQRNVHRYRPRG